uniref:V-type proton ATPase subunit G n=1 Tax=Seriola lalandi dorsalis TaxID=1841481 RepID=A0A3B4WNZ6_SERLL
MDATAKAHIGIQKLLQAEQDAAEIVAKAKQDKVARLKQAKAEADEEIAAYKAQRQAQFEVFSKDKLGDSGAHSKTTQSATEEELLLISQQVAVRWRLDGAAEASPVNAPARVGG